MAYKGMPYEPDSKKDADRVDKKAFHRNRRNNDFVQEDLGSDMDMTANPRTEELDGVQERDDQI